MPDTLFIVLLALVIFGPRRLPELAAHAGKYLALFSRMKRDLMEQMEEITKVRVAEEVGTAASDPVTTSDQSSYVNKRSRRHRKTGAGWGEPGRARLSRVVPPGARFAHLESGTCDPNACDGVCDM